MLLHINGHLVVSRIDLIFCFHIFAHCDPSYGNLASRETQLINFPSIAIAELLDNAVDEVLCCGLARPRHRGPQATAQEERPSLLLPCLPNTDDASTIYRWRET
jgi:hypothetical protein